MNFKSLLILFLIPAIAFAELKDPDDDTKMPSEKKYPSLNNQNQLPMGTEIKKFSEEVANRIDRIVKKKSFDLWGDPWTIQGIPLLFPSSSNGFNLGLRVALQNIRRQDPHKFEFEAQLLSSDLGRYKHMVKLDYPHLFDGKYRVTTRIAYDRDFSFPYFGEGNDTVIDRSRLNNDDPIYQNVRAGPSFYFQILRNFNKNLRIGPLLGLKWTQITAPAGSLLLSQNPSGVLGGRTHYVGLAIVHDTTDFEPYPSQGRVNELYMYWYAPFIGSEYNYFRFTYNFKRYHPLHRDLILAYRVFFESLTGNVPFYEMGATGGSNTTLGFGGDKFFRGFESNRFLDRLRLSVSVELRWDPLTFGFAKQQLTLGFVPFFDIGRVWPSLFPLTVGSLHASTGWGMRLIWNNRFIIRSDVAFNSERVGMYVELGSSF